MPYEIKGQCVNKKGGGQVGCTKGDVHKYMQALYANTDESENKMEKEAPTDENSITITESTKDLIKRLIRENLNKKS